MKLEEKLEIDIENKYIKNKGNTEFTIEEALYILKRKYFCDEVEEMAINKVINYIKEESIPRALLEEHKKEIEKRYYSILGKNSVEACVLKCKLEGIEEILTKGESK